MTMKLSNKAITTTPTNRHHLQNSLPTHQHGKFFSTVIIIAIIVGGVFFTFYMMELDHTIVTKFEGKRWNIPAKVYSSPLELYKGANVNDKTLDKWLNLLSYRQSTKYKQTGSYYKHNNTYYIHTRGFRYSNQDVDPNQILKVKIHRNKILSIENNINNQKNTGIFRLEPVNIGGIYPDNNEDRVLLKLDEVPRPLIDALIATEDRSFYQHHGVSFRGIARAIINNLSGKSMQGGSTLTQQLIKNFYLNSERSLKRKVNEALMALLLEVHYTKGEILQTYLNEINLGQNGNHSINGFGLAAQFYFNRPLNELTVDQQALLVGLAKGPSLYNPRRNPNNATVRRNVVLHNMLVMGKLSQADYDKAIKQPLGVIKTPRAGTNLFPAFLDIVKRELNEVYDANDLKNEGLQIITTLDPLAQSSADKAVRKKVKQLRKSSKYTKNLQSALVSANPATGELLAVVGGGNGQFTGFNRAIDAKRQVGSLLKPVIYLNALEHGAYNLASPVDDSPIQINIKNGKKWIPKNYGGRSHGQVSLTEALSQSYNQAAVRIGMQFGLDSFIDKLHKMGIKENIDPYPSAFLGSTALSPMDMLNVYQVFATGGFHTPIHSIRSVVDSQGRVLQRDGLSTEQSIDPSANYLINYALQQVVKKGTAKRALSLGKHLNLAGKTGTTNDYRDSWFAGYSGNYVSIVWVGRDDNKPVGLSGSNGALPIWIDYMKRLELTPVALTQPEDVEWVWLENNDGRLSQEECLEGRYLPILSEHLPREASECSVNLYEAEKRAEEQKWLDEQQSILDQRIHEGIKNEENTKPQKESATWFDKALEWF